MCHLVYDHEVWGNVQNPRCPVHLVRRWEPFHSRVHTKVATIEKLQIGAHPGGLLLEARLRQSGTYASLGDLKDTP
jgi:hypothetical protein